MTTTRADPITAEEVGTWRAHVGRGEVRRQRLEVEALRRFAAAQGADLDVERAPPPLAHWAFFLDTVATNGLGPDGHPRRGGLLPPVRLPRRMFAAATMTFAAPLILDAVAELELTVAAVTHKSGKTGDLVFVEVDRRLTQEGTTRLTERQTIVYRGLGAPLAPVVAAPAKPPPEAVIWTPGPVDLFRFSAATFNSHRIHYDLPYATGEEGYPGLVVHGPLTAARLFAFLRDRAGAPPRCFAFRAQSPLFAGQPITLAPGAAAGEGEAIRCDGAVAMTAQAEV